MLANDSYQVEIHKSDIIPVTVEDSIASFDTGVSGHAIFIRRLDVESFLM